MKEIATKQNRLLLQSTDLWFLPDQMNILDFARYTEACTMYKVCKTRQSAQRQRQISDVLFQMLRKNKLDDISICSFCRKAQIPRRTFYRYFDTLRDVVQYRFDVWKDDYNRFRKEQGFSSDVSPVQKIEQFLMFWEDQADFLEAIYYNNFLSALAAKIIASNLDIPNLNRLINNKGDVLDPEELLYFVIGGLMSVLIWDRNSKQRHSREELSQTLYYLMTNALYVADPRQVPPEKEKGDTPGI